MEADEIINVYIVTAKDQNKLDMLVEGINKREDCEDAVVRSVMNNLMFAATIRMSPDCGEEVMDWGYAVEPNEVQVMTEDSMLPWARDRIDQEDLPLDNNEFVTTGGEGVTIFIPDTGCFTNHVEFGSRVHNYADMITPDNPDGGDPNGHGTRCAGAAAGENIGMATQATVQCIRIAQSDGLGSTEHSLQGLDEVWRWTETHPGEKCVVSYSLSSSGVSPLIDAAAERLTDRCVVLTSAGNHGQYPETADACLYSPGRSDKIITVGASRLRNGRTEDDKAGFSCYGPCVDIYAPGHKVDLTTSIDPNGMVVTSGTSFACPLVAGAAAVLLGNGYGVDEVKTILLSRASQDKLQGLPNGDGNLLLNVDAPEFRQPKDGANF